MLVARYDIKVTDDLKKKMHSSTGICTGKFYENINIEVF